MSFENQATGNFIDIINGSDNIIHNCVIRNQNEYNLTYISPGDIVGISISAHDNSSAENNMILENEIYNVTDAIQLYRDDAGVEFIGDLGGIFIYNNHLYNTKKYIDQCGEERMNGEEAIDIKQGTGDHEQIACIEDKIIIANNSFYGWRRGGMDGLGRDFTDKVRDCISEEKHPRFGDCWHVLNGRGGGNGGAVNCHLNATNIAILYNTVSDCSNGFHISGENSKGHVGQIEIYNNTICNLYPSREYYASDCGSYWTNTNYVQNVWNSGNGDYLIPKGDGMNDGHCIPDVSGNYEYKIGHQIGEAMRSNTEYCIIQGNTISGAINGIYLDGIPGQKTVVRDNYIENIYHENFYPIATSSFADFTGNTYADFITVCSGGSGNNPPPPRIFSQQNIFLCSPNGSVIPEAEICNSDYCE